MPVRCFGCTCVVCSSALVSLLCRCLEVVAEQVAMADVALGFGQVNHAHEPPGELPLCSAAAFAAPLPKIAGSISSSQVSARTFGRVAADVDSRSGFKRALQYPRLWLNDSSKIMEEARHLKLATGPHVVPLLDIFRKRGSGLPILCMPLADIALSDLLARRGSLQETLGVSFWLQLCKGVGHLHNVPLVHGDITPANILLTDMEEPAGHMHVWLADFGAACRAPPSRLRDAYCIQPLAKAGHQTLAWPWSGQCCTLQYCAPEGFAGRAGCPADVWSAGAVAFEMMALHRLELGGAPRKVETELCEVPRRILALDRSGEDYIYMQERCACIAGGCHAIRPSFACHAVGSSCKCRAQEWLKVNPTERPTMNASQAFRKACPCGCSPRGGAAQQQVGKVPQAQKLATQEPTAPKPTHISGPPTSRQRDRRHQVS